MLIGRFFLALVTVGVVTATAQTQAGLPEYGVLLSGNTIINNSGHRILAYTVTYPQQGHTRSSTRNYLGELRRKALSEAGLGNGVFDINSQGINSQPVVMPTVRNARGEQVGGPGVAPAALDAVLFDDGRLVGPDTTKTFDLLTVSMQAERDVHSAFVRGGLDAARALMAETQNEPTTIPNFRYRSQVHARVRELEYITARGGQPPNIPDYPTIHKETR